MARTDPSFLGCGWAFPPVFSRAAHGVEMVRDAKDIRESLWILFSTSFGERIMVPEYGCALWQMVFQNMTATLMNELKEMVEQAILNWEPRIDVDQIDVYPDPNVDGLVQISVGYTIRTTNTRNNFVYPFYFLEATIAPQSP